MTYSFFSSTVAACHHCDNYHPGACPKIKAIEYHSDGITVRRVEYFEPTAPRDPGVYQPVIMWGPSWPPTT
jgi:hypothetical protein